MSFQSTVVQHAVIIGAANEAIASTAIGTTGQVLLGNTGADPTWGPVPSVQNYIQVYLNNSVTNVTGDGTTYGVIFDTVEHDPLSAYNVSSGVWTAPATGIYQFTAMVAVAALTASFTQFSIVVQTGTLPLTNTINPGAARDVNNRVSLMISQSLFINAGVTLQVFAYVSGSTKSITVTGVSTQRYTSLSIARVG